MSIDKLKRMYGEILSRELSEEESFEIFTKCNQYSDDDVDNLGYEVIINQIKNRQSIRTAEAIQINNSYYNVDCNKLISHLLFCLVKMQFIIENNNKELKKIILKEKSVQEEIK